MRRLTWKPMLAVAVLATGISATFAVDFFLRTRPLSPDEYKALVVEIKEMVNTEPNDVTRFVVRNATPQRIEKFYAMPGIAESDSTLRKNGLVFGGLGGDLLTFDRPSDVLSKMERWFPSELAASRTRDRDASYHLRMPGPYENWAPEPTAFMVLWKCYPRMAWLKPDRQPFAGESHDSSPMMPIEAKSSSHQEYDFGFCARNNAGYVYARTEQQRPSASTRALAIGEAAAKVLVNHFARFLEADGCRRTGPDDCVLVMNVWASLQPEDPALARLIQTLERQVSPDSPLPPTRRSLTPDDINATSQDVQERFEAGLRVGGFLQAKLRSVLALPQAWPHDALAGTLAQMTVLRRKMEPAYAARWSGSWQLDRNANALSNPWLPITASVSSPSLRNAVVQELLTIGADPWCNIHDSWFKSTGSNLQTHFVLQKFAAREPLGCGQVDWTALRERTTDEARQAGDDFLRLAADARGEDRDTLLNEASNGGSDCFANPFTGGSWLRQLCDVWISRPQTLSTRELRGEPHRAWSPVRTAAIPPHALDTERNPSSYARQTAWLMQLSPSRSLQDALRAIGAEMERQQLSIVSVARWNERAGGQSLIALQTDQPIIGNEVWPLSRPRMLLHLHDDRAKLVGIPHRFEYQYDEGSVVQVTDVDTDGDPEVWFSGMFGECDDPSAKPGIDCAIETIHFGEVHGDTLTWFRQAPSANRKPDASRR